MEIRPILSTLLRNKTAPLLVAIQVALSLAILANAMYVVHLRLATSMRPSGIEDESSLVSIQSIPMEKPSHNDYLAQQRRERDTLAALPGVVSATSINQLPMTYSGSTTGIFLDPKQERESAQPSMYLAPEPFVKTLGLKLLEGREFQANEVVELNPDVDSGSDLDPAAVIVTQALARHLFPDAGSVIGKMLYLGIGDNVHGIRIVGVVERLQTPNAQASEEGEYSIALPIRMSMPFHIYAVRTEPGMAERVIAEAEEALRKLSASPIRVHGKTLAQVRADRYRNERAMAWMLIAVSALLLLVTVSGIVGMTMLRVAQRKKQIGVRRALGARWRDILRYFLVENFLITSAGIALGIVLAIGLNQVLANHLEAKKLPFAYLAYGACALWLLGLAAVWGPASRAASTPPATATRSV